MEEGVIQDVVNRKGGGLAFLGKKNRRRHNRRIPVQKGKGRKGVVKRKEDKLKTKNKGMLKRLKLSSLNKGDRGEGSTVQKIKIADKHELIEKHGCLRKKRGGTE